jgi:hypothetical protein
MQYIRMKGGAMYFLSIHPNTQDLGNHARYSKGWNTRPYESIHQMALDCQKYLSSPCIWSYGNRNQENFNFADMIVIDVDDDRILPLEKAKEKFADFIHFIGTTKSHNLLKGELVSARYRIFVSLERRCYTASDFKRVSLEAARVCGADEQAAIPSQHFMPIKNIVSLNSKGRSWPFTPSQEEIRVKKNLLKIDTNSGGYRSIPPYVERWLKGDVPRGQRNQHCFKTACALFRRGFNALEIEDIILNSSLPIGRTEAIEREVRSTIKSAARHYH